MSGFFMPENQLLIGKTRNTNILIPINFHLSFNNLGLTPKIWQLKLSLIDS
jgi:bacterioferritin